MPYGAAASRRRRSSLSSSTHSRRSSMNSSTKSSSIRLSRHEQLFDDSLRQPSMRMSMLMTAAMNDMSSSSNHGGENNDHSYSSIISASETTIKPTPAVAGHFVGPNGELVADPPRRGRRVPRILGMRPKYDGDGLFRIK
ncbi:expressed unknown protein [Seminavis robusta]|uniref:Uncharacterized protein n=1 Tax=Seminavis robusta TaxID=568900 RepID=A0A9N8EVG1_9STRA|nr:expressed unknown protein [Seminavis robusta]|eukprot:Sro1995_g310010.1 n/a (140) ;mRNA; f:14379-14798